MAGLLFLRRQLQMTAPLRFAASTRFLSISSALASKRPPTAYILFSMENRDKVANEIGSDKVGDIGKRMGELWRSLDEDDKEPYIREYQERMQEYREELDSKDKPPVNPKSPYVMFLRAQGPDMDVTKMGTVWKKLSKAEKENFASQFAEAKEEYEQELEVWKNSNSEDYNTWQEIKEKYKPLTREQFFKQIRRSKAVAVQPVLRNSQKKLHKQLTDLTTKQTTLFDELFAKSRRDRRRKYRNAMREAGLAYLLE
eukprot:TRINITY_DN6360_c0_g1_i2.p1 TRINITY_DN6360_c0_g1~~TRINITY_DN6360_c0_g1_i2.p1  ORF type:complete len:255 (+),score=85.39 TRINITY_DN6360_c0_g1_i2:91-855(+)